MNDNRCLVTVLAFTLKVVCIDIFYFFFYFTAIQVANRLDRLILSLFDGSGYHAVRKLYRCAMKEGKNLIGSW